MALSRYCLDTSAYSHFKRGDPRVVNLLDSAEWLGIPSIVLGELWTGFILGNRLEKNDAELRDFLDHPVVETLVIDDEVARIYGEIVVDLRKAATPIPTNDIWIAATAVRVGATVLTYDPHFSSISRVGALVLPKPAL